MQERGDRNVLFALLRCCLVPPTACGFSLSFGNSCVAFCPIYRRCSGSIYTRRRGRMTLIVAFVAFARPFFRFVSWVRRMLVPWNAGAGYVATWCYGVKGRPSNKNPVVPRHSDHDTQSETRDTLGSRHGMRKNTSEADPKSEMDIDSRMTCVHET